MNAGDPIEFQAFPAITQAQLKAYAEASGDYNPIHQDEATAKAMGLPGVIAHGMLTAALVGERAQRFAFEESRGHWIANSRLTSFQTRFRTMVLLGDVVSVGGTVKLANETEIILELQARTQKGEVAVTAEARFSR